MFDVDFLNGVMGNEELTAEQKVQSIIDEHNASERGLIQKRDELLAGHKKDQEKIKGWELKGTEYDTKIADLEHQLQVNNPEERKKYYETQIEGVKKGYEDKLLEQEKQLEFYRNSHFEMLKSNAINEGIKDFVFVDGLKDGFVANVMYKNDFTAKDIDGNIVFLNKDNKTIPEVMKDFAMTTEGKAYLRNPTSGAGSRTSSGNYSTKNTMTRSEFEKMRTENPNKVSEFFAKGGKIID